MRNLRAEVSRRGDNFGGGEGGHRPGQVYRMWSLRPDLSREGHIRGGSPKEGSGRDRLPARPSFELDPGTSGQTDGSLPNGRLDGT